jgi:hypothetical protein
MPENKNQALTLIQASKSKYYKKIVSIQALVTGKALTPYQIPRKVSFQCNPTRGCSDCAVRESPDKTLTLKPENPDFVRFIGISDMHMETAIRHAFCIRPNCFMDYKIETVYTVEEIYMTEVILEKTTSYISRIGYIINSSVECNNPYEFTCYSIPEPKQQKIVHIILDIKKLKTDIESFSMTKKINDDLRIFQPEDSSTKGIFLFLEKIYEIYSSDVTKIYKRFDLHMAVDLVFHSPLQFYFDNELIYKGWLDAMVIGDTRCGKGYVSESLVRYYGMGDIVSGENLSFAGLVGGVQQANNRWIVTWGKIPLNNRRLVVIDESGEMESKDFSRLSRIRSEGIAEITKIQTERASAMTRLLFLSNPKHRLISSYSFGIESILDLIENAEDIARFDYVLVVAQDEVDINEINQPRENLQNPYASYDPILVQWIWSRKSDEVKFTPEATNSVFKHAVKLGTLYSSKIPLIQGENIRVKLAKIAAAIAGRIYSADPKGEILIVDENHVEAAYVFLNMIYKKKVSGYYFYSQIQKQVSDIYEFKDFEKYFHAFENLGDMIDYFMQNNYITLTDLSEHIDQPKEIAREIISKLLHHKCIQKKYTFYVKNQCFVDWLRRTGI